VALTPQHPLKLALASLTGGDRSIGIVRLRTKNHGVFFFLNIRCIARCAIFLKVSFDRRKLRPRQFS
jgi:hypothetical protein